jgi:hypothetical protein
LQNALLCNEPPIEAAICCAHPKSQVETGDDDDGGVCGIEDELGFWLDDDSPLLTPEDESLEQAKNIVNAVAKQIALDRKRVVFI